MNNHLRNIKLGLIQNQWDIKLDASKKCHPLYFLRPKSTLVKQILPQGSILTGSSALKCYSINNRPILDRSPDDWDLIITEDMLIKLCDGIIPGININEKDINLIKSTLLFTGYGNDDVTYVLPTKIHLIVKDELPEYNFSKGIKVAKLEHIIETKIALYEGKGEFYKHRNSNKHLVDLHRII